MSTSKSNDNPTLDFGKYAGRRVNEVPWGYLCYLCAWDTKRGMWLRQNKMNYVEAARYLFHNDDLRTDYAVEEGL